MDELLAVGIGLALEALVIPAAAVVSALVEGAILAVVCIAEAAEYFLRRRRIKPRDELPASGSWAGKTFHRIGLAAGVLFAATGMLLAALQIFAFEPTVRFLAGQVGRRSGVEISFESATGSLFTGWIDLSKVRLSRAPGKGPLLELDCRAIELDVRMSSLMAARPVLETLSIDGLTGRMARGEARVRRGEGLLIEELRVRDSEVSWVRGPDSDEPRVTIESLLARGFSTRRAVFCLLFQSDITGALAGRPFEVSSESRPDGTGASLWKAAGVPAAAAGKLAGGPLAWLTQGTLDLRVESRWKLAPPPDLRMSWKLDGLGLEAKAPSDMGWLLSKLAAPLLKRLNADGGPRTLEFEVELDPDRLRVDGNVAAKALWDALAAASARAIGKLAKLPGSALDPLVKKLIEAREKGESAER